MMPSFIKIKHRKQTSKFFPNSIYAFNHMLREVYKIGFDEGVKQEKCRQTIAYNKLCDRFGI